MTNLLFTNKEGIETIANYKNVSATQLAAQLVWEIDELGESRVLNAAENSYKELGGEFIKLIKSFKDQVVFI
jgi:hypothetical protein